MIIKEEELTEENLNKISNSIKDGKVIAFPTETVYGVGVNGFDEEAIRLLYKIKKRPIDKPISLLVSSVDMIKEVASDITDKELKIIEKFFPGPLTIIVKKSEKVPNILTNNSPYVGIRMPQNDTALKIIDSANSPLAVTSANMSGEESDTEFSEVYNDFKECAEYLVDGGKSKLGVASTVIQLVNGEVKVYREGLITEEEINKVIEE